MHPKNTTAPPGTQASTGQDAADDMPRGFIWFSVDRVLPNIRITGFPVLNKGLAVELYEMLCPELKNERVVIQPCAGDSQDFQLVSQQAARHKDLILSCRSAERPGHEYLARIGHFGRYNPAPQNEQLPFRGAPLEGDQ